MKHKRSTELGNMEDLKAKLGVARARLGLVVSKLGEVRAPRHEENLWDVQFELDRAQRDVAKLIRFMRKQA